MKTSKNLSLLTPVVALLGLIGLLLRRQLYRTRLEPSGLLAPSPLETWLTVLSVLTVAVIALGSLMGRFSSDRKDIYPASTPAALCNWAAALALLLSGIIFLPGQDWFQRILGILGVLAGPALAHSGWKRSRGRRPETLLQILVCLYFLGMLTYEFRLRGHDPQIQDYAFQVLALLSLSMASFLRLCLDIEPQKQRFLYFCTHCALYFSLVALSAGTEVLLYAAGAAWALGNIPQEEPR